MAPAPAGAGPTSDAAGMQAPGAVVGQRDCWYQCCSRKTIRANGDQSTKVFASTTPDRLQSAQSCGVMTSESPSHHCRSQKPEVAAGSVRCPPDQPVRSIHAASTLPAKALSNRR